MVRGTWARGHASRAQNPGTVRPFPKPSELTDEIMEDIGELVPDDPPDSPLPGDTQPAPAPEPPAGPDPEPGEDEPPGHMRDDWRGAKKPRTRPQSKPIRVTAGVRSDITAKISFALEVPGRVWQARDPVCGSVFIDQRPDIADALADIVCDSPDLLAFFTGPGGNFMKGLKLMAAVWPVVTVAMAHHVYHSIEAAPVEPDYAQYAA